MQAIEHTIGAAKARSVDDLEQELEAARNALDDLEISKLRELQDDAGQLLTDRVEERAALAQRVQQRAQRAHEHPRAAFD